MADQIFLPAGLLRQPHGRSTDAEMLPGPILRGPWTRPECQTEMAQTWHSVCPSAASSCPSKRARGLPWQSVRPACPAVVKSIAQEHAARNNTRIVARKSRAHHFAAPDQTRPKWRTSLASCAAAASLLRGYSRLSREGRRRGTARTHLCRATVAPSLVIKAVRSWRRPCGAQAGSRGSGAGGHVSPASRTRHCVTRPPDTASSDKLITFSKKLFPESRATLPALPRSDPELPRARATDRP